jgi:hypothetical protein
LGNTDLFRPFSQKKSKNSLAFKFIHSLQQDFEDLLNLAGIQIEAESIIGYQIAGRDDTTNFYTALGFQIFWRHLDSYDER